MDEEEDAKRSTTNSDGEEGDKRKSIDGDDEGEDEKGNATRGEGDERRAINDEGEGDKWSTSDGDGVEDDKGSTIDGDGGEGDKVNIVNQGEGESVQVRKNEQMWIAKLGLYTHDHNILLSGTKWLNDNIIYASQLFLKKQSKGKIEGWHSTQCCKLKELFPPLAPAARYIQILNVCGNHWIVASNIKVHYNDIFREGVCIYDSMWHTSVSLRAKRHLC